MIENCEKKGRKKGNSSRGRVWVGHGIRPKPGVQVVRGLVPSRITGRLVGMPEGARLAVVAHVLWDVEIRGTTLEAGSLALLLVASANRDEEVFEDPFRFDIERSPNDHVAFGFGTHFCMGNSLARLELRVMFEELLVRLPDLELVSTEEPAHRAANFVSGYEHLPVRFTPTAPLGSPS